MPTMIASKPSCSTSAFPPRPGSSKPGDFAIRLSGRRSNLRDRMRLEERRLRKKNPPSRSAWFPGPVAFNPLSKVRCGAPG